MKSFFESEEWNIKFAEEFHSKLEFDVFDEALPTFFNRKWTILRAGPASGGFVTSDHPACLVWSPSVEASPLIGPGLAVPGTQLIFPVSPEIAIMGTFEGGADCIEADEFHVAQVNQVIAGYAERQIVAPRPRFLFARPARHRAQRHASAAFQDQDRDGRENPAVFKSILEMWRRQREFWRFLRQPARFSLSDELGPPKNVEYRK